MKKRVLILLSLAMMISLAAIAYSAAVTNPGHGVEEIGSGSSPYASRMWNALNTGYQEYYTGPAALRSNIPWFGTINAETTAAQNAQGDYCAIHTTPTGVFINCLNNATNITLTQSYSWNGTNFTKNDTIRNESHVFEEHLVTAGPAGTTVSTTLANPNSGTVTQSCSTTSPPTCSEQAINPGGLKLWSIVNEESAGAGTSTWEWLDGANANAGFEETTHGDGTTGKTMVNKDPATGTPLGGGLTLDGTGFDFSTVDSVTAADGSITSTLVGGEPITTITNIDSTGANTIGQSFNPTGGTGLGSISFTAPTMAELTSGGNIITDLGEALVGAGDPPAFILGADRAFLTSFTQGAPPCVLASVTWAAGVGVTITDIDVTTGLPCPVPSLATFAFYAILDD